MNREDLFKAITNLVKEAEKDGSHPEYSAALAILYALLGAMGDNEDFQLMNHVMEYAETHGKITSGNRLLC